MSKQKTTAAPKTSALPSLDLKYILRITGVLLVICLITALLLGIVNAVTQPRIDAMQAALPAIDKFTLPGGHPAVSLCHVCRTVCRRAERAALRADQEFGVDASALVWLNRLSDYFYLLGRTLTVRFRVEEVLWIP